MSDPFDRNEKKAGSLLEKWAGPASPIFNDKARVIGSALVRLGIDLQNEGHPQAAAVMELPELLSDHELTRIHDTLAAREIWTVLVEEPHEDDENTWVAEAGNWPTCYFTSAEHAKTYLDREVMGNEFEKWMTDWTLHSGEWCRVVGTIEDDEVFPAQRVTVRRLVAL